MYVCSIAMASEWTTVTKRSHKKLVSRKSPRYYHNRNVSKRSVTTDDDWNYEEAKAKIDHAVDELKATEFCKDFLQDFCDILKRKGALSSTEAKSEQECKTHKLVCYGLGRIAASCVSRFQLALLLILREHLSKQQALFSNKLQVKCDAYDPVFTELDNSLLQSYDIEVLSHNEEGRRDVRSANELTTFFMLHCDKFLYNNLLEANQRSLHKLIIIGNSFTSIRERMLERQLEDEYKFIHQVLSQEIVKEIPLNNWQKMDDIFNDTSIHHFQPKS